MNLGILALETFYWANLVPFKVKILLFYGLIFTELYYGFIWFNFHLDSVA